MSSTFKQAVEMAYKLPEKEQDALGALLLQEMESEQRWSELFQDSQGQLAKLADAALLVGREGRTQPFPE